MIEPGVYKEIELCQTTKQQMIHAAQVAVVPE